MMKCSREITIAVVIGVALWVITSILKEKFHPRYHTDPARVPHLPCPCRKNVHHPPVEECKVTIPPPPFRYIRPYDCGIKNQSANLCSDLYANDGVIYPIQPPYVDYGCDMECETCDVQKFNDVP